MVDEPMSIVQGKPCCLHTGANAMVATGNLVQVHERLEKKIMLTFWRNG